MDNSKEITIYDIANELNLSAATISRGLKDHPAISKSTKKKIQDTAKKMGYRFNTFASNLRMQRTHTIGVIVQRLDSFFVSSVLAGIEKVANECGFNTIISQSLESVTKEITNAETMFNSRVDGLLVSLAANTDNIDHFESFLQKNIPVIFFDRVYNDRRCLSIIIDNYKNAYDITNHLIEQKCKRLIHVTGNLRRNVYIERLRGFKDAIENAGIPFKKSMVIECGMNEQAGLDIGERILQMKQKPDGIFVANDQCAANIMHILISAGIDVPKDIAIAGFNNDPIARVVTPKLTTINYPGYEMGVIAAQNMITHLSGNMNLKPANTIILNSELVIRESSVREIK